MENGHAKFLDNSNLLFLFGIILATISGITICIFIISVALTIWQEDYINMDFCLSSSCVLSVKSGFLGSIYLVEQGLKLAAGVAAIFGVFIALRSYLVSVSAAALTGHIGYLRLFQDYITSEVERRDKLSLSNIDVFRWYNKIFPQSVNGNVQKPSQEYIQDLKSIENAIQATNDSLRSSSGQYNYNHHQTQLIPLFKAIGIEVSRAPRNDFFAAEDQLLELIDSVNMTFSVTTEPLHVIHRRYTN